MSCTKKYCFIIFGFILLPSNITADIEMDYFFGEGTLRTNDLVCKTDALKQECSMMCGAKNYGCIFDECVCLDWNLKRRKLKQEENLPPSKEEIKMVLTKFENLIDMLSRYSSDEESAEVEIIEHPALRHHIAHFCPNLAVARQCIRKCMQLGKPAFCGKDHNCYCGHKYDQHSVDAPVDVDDMYAKYRDLYTKYFGAEGSDPVHIFG